VVAEYSTTSGNANTIAKKILEKILAGDSRVSYSQDRHMFHVLCDNGLVFLCMADEAFGRRIPFAFLEETRRQYLADHGNDPPNLQRAYSVQFSSKLRSQMEYYSTNPDANVIERVRGETAETKKVMVEVIDKVLDRGERIELLVDKTDTLRGDAFKFKRHTTQLKRNMWWKNIKMMMLIFVLVIALIYVLLCFICSPTLDCHKKKN